MKRHNLHTHTTYSDGSLTPEILIDELAKRKYEVVGITDHGFTRKADSVSKEYLPLYISNLKSFQEREKRIRLKVGLEIDLEMTGTDPETLPMDLLNQLDFVLFETLTMEKDETNYGIRSIARIRDRLTIPAGLAHYDYRNVNYFENVLRLLKEYDIFFELNTGHGTGFLDNPSDIGKVAELFRKYEISLTVGTDLHTLSSIDYSNGRRTPDYAFDFIRDNGLTVLEMVS